MKRVQGWCTAGSQLLSGMRKQVSPLWKQIIFSYMPNATEPTQHQQRFTVGAVKGSVIDIHHTWDPRSLAAGHVQHQHHAKPMRQTQPRGADIFACCVIGCRSSPEKETQSHSPMSPGLHTARPLRDAPLEQTPPEPHHPAAIPSFSVS